MRPSVLGFHDIDTTKLALVGGKGVNLGELFHMQNIQVPEGFCVTTDAYVTLVRQLPAFDVLVGQLSGVSADDVEQVRDLSQQIRSAIETAPMGKNIGDAVVHHLMELGENNAYAVRSSATAEDLPTASFAGQQDTYLNIIGKDAILAHIRKCWASLFTDRAVMYRMQNGFDHHKVRLAVIIQRMVFPDASGILFTADPVTGNRKVASIDAGFGLGEALVSGLVNPDIYTVRDGKVTGTKISSKKLAIEADKEGGTRAREIGQERQNDRVLTDAQILELERIGRKIEAHFGRPQDIEWCLADGKFFIVQSRPITTLFPVPTVNDQQMHVYISVGHQQMMTDAMKPLGISVWQLTAARLMATAGGRLFVDIAQQLQSAAGRHMLIHVLGKSDPLLKDAMMTIVERKDLLPPLPDAPKEQGAAAKAPPLPDFQTLKDHDPAVVAELMGKSEASIDALRRDIRDKSGSDLMDYIVEDIPRLQKSLTDPQSFDVFMTAMNASAWINEHVEEWLGEKNVADTLTLSVPHNVTSEMGLALLDLADAIRPYPEIVEYLRGAKEENFLDALAQFDGGKTVCAAFAAYLHKYGMRCTGEIDITRPRWGEKPTTLLPLILANVQNFAPGERARTFERGRQQAMEKEREILERLKRLPDGERKAADTQRMIGLVRNFIGYREYPKYAMMSRYFVYKQALLGEAERLVRAGVLCEQDDMYYLTLEDLREAVRTQKVDHTLIASRKEDFRWFETLTPPRVMTSDGEIITGRYKRENLPPGALVGLAVSSGVVEGRARVIRKMEEANLEEGDILVTAFTDPGWTPLFVSIKGLVTEVGGLMTHGAVIAREYGLPAVVGVENATKLIKDGQRIRVHGTEGWVEML